MKANLCSGRIWNLLAATYKMASSLKSVALFGRTPRTCLRPALTGSSELTTQIPMTSTPTISDVTIINKRRWFSDVTADENAAVKGFRVITYNILTDNYLRDGKYSYCPAHLRYMSSRHERIMAEISDMEPHIVCLQVRFDSLTHPQAAVSLTIASLRVTHYTIAYSNVNNNNNIIPLSSLIVNL